MRTTPCFGREWFFCAPLVFSPLGDNTDKLKIVAGKIFKLVLDVSWYEGEILFLQFKHFISDGHPPMTGYNVNDVFPIMLVPGSVSSAAYSKHSHDVTIPTLV